jgi:RNA polymerase sigma-70 factor, ECF subfamily
MSTFPDKPVAEIAPFALSNPRFAYVVLGMSGWQLSNSEDLARAPSAEHAEALLAYVQRLVHGDRQLAEDIVQETLLRAWKNRDRMPEGSRRPWLFVTARHLVIDAYRARKARPIEVTADLVDMAPKRDDLDATLDAIVVSDALRTLSPEHRAVLFDSYYRGQTVDQIAEARGIPPGTVRSRMHYAIRAMRLALHERGVNQ